MDWKDIPAWWAAVAATGAAIVPFVLKAIEDRRRRMSEWRLTAHSPTTHVPLQILYSGDEAVGIVRVEVIGPRGLEISPTERVNSQGRIGVPEEWGRSFNSEGLLGRSGVFWFAGRLSNRRSKSSIRLRVRITIEFASSKRARDRMMLTTQEITLSDSAVISAASSQSTNIAAP